MLSYILSAVQIVALLIIGIGLWQIWRFLNRKDIPEEEPLGEERAKYLTTRFSVLGVFFVIEAILAIVQVILRFARALE